MGIRGLAAILAWGSSFFGFLAAGLLVFLGFPPWLILAFAPGYVLWVFYTSRWLAIPSLRIRYTGWWLSLIVQGAWLAWFHVVCGERYQISCLFLDIWWGGASLASIWALAWEHRVPTRWISDRAPAGLSPHPLADRILDHDLRY